MSEKQFDHIENRIREAAENSEPDFDEHAWKLMEARLDMEDNKRYRFLLWPILLPLLLLTIGSVYLFVNRIPAGKIKGQLKEENTIAVNAPQQKKNEAASTVSANPINNKKNDKSPAPITAAGQTKPAAIDHAVITSTEAGNRQTAVNKNGVTKKIIHNKKGKLTTAISASSTTDDAKVYDNANEKGSQQLPGTVSAEAIPIPETKKPVADVVVIKNETEKKADSSKKDVSKNEPASNKSKTATNKNTSRFYFIAAVGADAASVKFLSLKDSKIAPKYGVGIGYQLNKKVSIQTGFYASWKKYIAGPEDYNTKHGTYWDTVKILKVDASCLVYDIPIILRYNFLQNRTTTLYTTAGISSFIMKQEDYTYHYNDYYNNYHAKPKTYTGNKNLFAVFDLSAGIEKKISSNFSILAEPSIGIPVGGVGEGSVKLYSTALQLGLKYSPSKKRK
jgi:hypothetical protein